MSEDENRWLNYHLYYHQDMGEAIHHFVHPLIAGFREAGSIESFFFVRYWLGGPHIRLRLRPRPGASALVAEAAVARARDFLVSRPSRSKIPPETILRINKKIMASDPHELDAAIYPDNTFLKFPFRPEVERYGGPEYWRDSLDLFAVSSAVALDLLARCGREPRSHQLALVFRVLACQALSFARDEEDLVGIARYAVDLWGARMPKAIAKGDRAFVQQRKAVDRVLERELELLAAGARAAATAVEEAKARLGEAALRLAWIVRAVDRDVSRRIGTSQLHMTANRLGLNNVEEVYLSRILSRWFGELIASGEAPGRLPAGVAVMPVRGRGAPCGPVDG